MSFQKLGLSAELVRAVAEQGYTDPTPIQSQAIPVVLSGRDLLGAAQTGTGKTASFTLPMLQLLAAKPHADKSPARHVIRALVLVPTRELAAQVQESVRTYGKHLKLRTAVIYGGVGFKPQADELKRGVDIVVGTPGRVLDHLEQQTIDLGQIEILVLDEADRMLDMGFIPQIRRVLEVLPPKRQNLLFSATFPDEVRTLAAGFMHDPVTVEVARRNMPIESIRQIAHPIESERKRALLAHLVKSNDWQQVLVFTRTKHGANRLAQQLEREGIETAAIHGDKSQPQRVKALKRFKDGELQLLVATDIAARGIDIEALPHVVNYDLPNVPEDYVHRIGRTGRAGESGEAVSLISNEDLPMLRDIERLIGKNIEQQAVAGFEPGPDYHLAVPKPQQRGAQRQRNAPRRADTSSTEQRRSKKQSARASQPVAQGRRSDPARRDDPSRRDVSSRRDDPARRDGAARRNDSVRRDKSASSNNSARGNDSARRDSSTRRDDPTRRNDGPRRGNQGRGREQRVSLSMPLDRDQELLRKEQLEEHRRQQAKERGEAAPEQKPSGENPAQPSKRRKGKAMAALFALVQRKGS